MPRKCSKVIKDTNAWARRNLEMTPWREPRLNHFTGEKKSIQELARLCGLVYKNGRVG